MANKNRLFPVRDIQVAPRDKELPGTANKQRLLPPQAVPPKSLIEEPQIGFEGFRSDASSHILPLSSAAKMDHLRLEKGALRKDFGWSALGLTAGNNRILALGEHKYIYNDLTYQRLYRIFRVVGLVPKIQVWSGTSWTDVITSAEVIQDELLSTVSIQGVLAVADGAKILKWTEELALVAQEDDFPAGNSLTAVGHNTQASVVPAGAYDNTYHIAYDITMAGGTAIEVELEFFHNATSVGTKIFTATAAELPFSALNQIFEFTRTIVSGDTVKIQIKRIDAGSSTDVLNTNNFVLGANWDAAKSPGSPEAYNQIYNYRYWIDGSAIDVTLWYNTGAGWVNAGTYVHVAGVPAEYVQSIIIPGMGVGSQFRITHTGSPLSFVAYDVTWIQRTVTASTTAVHGHNKAISGDLPAGVAYSTAGAPVTVFNLLSADAPAARFVFSFGDRLIALGDLGDDQSLAWSADGDVLDFAGGDSGQISLVDARIDAIDELMAGAPIGSSFAALYRRRSIMRMFESGNTAQAIAATHWIEGLGTDSRFSVQVVPGGNIFLGSDKTVYYLTEGGQLQALSGPIQNELMQALTGNLDRVDSLYDPVTQEYWVGIPELGYSYITAVWIFNFGAFQREGVFEWRRRPFQLFRMAVVSAV